jgi:O-antigen/teichoic acid export membrane protein
LISIGLFPGGINISNSRILAKNLLSQVITLFTGKIFGAVASIALIRYLGADKQGIYSYVISMIALFSFITDFGLSSLLVREMKAAGEKNRKLFGNAIMLQLGQIAASIILINIYAAFFEINHEAKSSLMLASFCFTLLYMSNPFIATLNSYEKMHLSGLANGLASFFNAVFIFTAIYLKMDLLGIIFMLGASNLIFVMLSTFLCVKYAVVPIFEFDRGIFISLMKMCLPFAIMGLFNYIYERVDVLLLFKMKTAAEVGYYSAATKIISILNATVMMIMSPTYPRLSVIINTETKEKALRVINISVKYMMCLVAPFAMMVTVLSPDYTRILLGAEFVQSSTALGILIWSIFLIGINVIPIFALNAARLEKNVTYIYGINIIINIALNIILIPHFSYLATSAINILCNIFVMASGLFLVNRNFGKTTYQNDLMKIIGALIPQAVFMLSFRGKMNYLLLSASGIAVFLAAVVLIRYFKDDDFTILKNVFKKNSGSTNTVS